MNHHKKVNWQINGRALLLLLLTLLLIGGCQETAVGKDLDVGETVVPAPVTPTVTPQATPNPLPYGLVYATAKSDWTEADRTALRSQLEMIHDMGINTVVQTFSSRLAETGREADWLIFLDEAQRANIQVIARLWPLTEDENEPFDLEPVATFLEITGDHPALLAYLGLHEPLERFNSEQMRQFYASIKEIAPQVPVAHYMGSMALFDGSLRFPGRRFTDGICDICIVWCTPAQTRNGEPYFDETAVTQTVRDNRQLIDERAPSSQLWFLGQTYALAAHRHQLRMPTPDEMDQIFTLATNEGIDGFLWYPWLHGNYDQVLSSPEMEAQQQAVLPIIQSYLADP
jgi:hypothetical protein